MIPSPSFHGAKLAVFGLGRSGLAAAKSLAASGAEVIAWDDHEQALDDARAAGLSTQNLRGLNWRGVNALVLSPGIPMTHPAPHEIVAQAQDNGVAVFGDMELFARARAALPDHQLIAITGTNGKSTTTALTGHILKSAQLPVAIGGNIGTGVMGLDPLPRGGVYVFELSSYQIEQTRSLASDIAILLNITPDHLDRHGGMKGYKAAKAHLFAMQRAHQVAVIAMDDAPCRAIAKNLRSRLLPVSGVKRVKGGVYVEDGILKDELDGKTQVIGAQADWPVLIGRHNAQNAAAATAAALTLGVKRETIASALKSFKGLAHRLQLVGEWRGIRFINDSKATNMDAAATALASFDKRVRWIAGGRAKSQNLGAVADKLKIVAKAYLIGEAAPLFAKLLDGRVETASCGTMDAAIAQAIADCGDEGGIILLAPGCASFDQYQNFEQRGDAFIAAVRAQMAEERP